MYDHEKYIEKNKKIKRGKIRLPTIDELSLMFNKETGKPVIEGFTSSFYWSSTILVNGAGNAWYVSFNGGGTYYSSKTLNYYVRCVEETENGIVWLSSTDVKMNWYEAIKYAESLNE
jgi:hypothetical protein